MSAEIRLTVVIPAYNEETRIAPSLRKAVRVLAELLPEFEILVVDDGSSDRTIEVARAAVEGTPGGEGRFRALVNEQNLGKGGAVRRGMLDARGAYVLFCDADESTPMASIERFLPLMDTGKAVLIGTRKKPGCPHRPGISPWLRETMGKGFTWLAKLLIGVQVSDFTCGFKVFRRDAAQAIFSRQNS